ncbi:TonB-dependent receptor [Flavobacterium sp.]|uniref:TonB-dependent receptor n=1 Tax=Flavobacterium sp. TaxID=239 RepID=UPI00286AAFAF|nr:TonB-dependent receptor [Flavobacterium sp.]
MSKNRIVFLILFIFSFLFVTAQEGKKNTSLKTILTQISQDHKIQFNYIDDEIAVYNIAPPKNELSLQAKIDYIKQETSLEFKIIDQKYYTIYNNNKKFNKPNCGYLFDSKNNIPVENAYLYILNTNISTTSNEKGYFELPSISSNDIQIKHFGYEPKTISSKDLYNLNCANINLNSIIFTLDEVVTQRYLTTGILIKNDATIIIKPKKFGILSGLIEPDILQTMQQIPGILSVDETVSNINVRGGTNDQNLFLWNGIRMFQTGHFFGLISAFNPSLSHTISITKNGTSAFYGESVSSLVDMSSHSKNTEINHSSIGLNLISAELYSKFNVSEKANVEISARRSFTDFLTSPTYRNYRNRIFQNTIVTNQKNNQTQNFDTKENFYFYDFSLQYEHQIGKNHKLIIDGISIQNQLDINQIPTSENNNNNLSQSNFGGNITWETIWDKKNESEINFYVSNYNLDAKNESILNNRTLIQQNNVLDMGFKIQNTHQISENLTFKNGYQFDEIGVTNLDEINNPIFSRIVKEVIRSHAIVGEIGFKSESKKTYLKTGIRTNYFEKFKKILIEPRLVLNQNILENLNLEILGELKSQSISQVIDLQQDFLGIEKRRWTLSNNTSIPIQKSSQISVGFTFKNNSWLFTLDNFYKKIKGITSGSQGFQNQFEFEKSTGNYRVLGSEILVQKSFGKFYSWVNYSFNTNKYNFDSLSSSVFPNNYEIIHTVSCAAVYESETWKMTLGSKWHSGKPITTPLNNELMVSDFSNPKINYNSPNNSTLPNYFQLNFSASKDWELTERTKMVGSFSVLNILNKKNTINRFYRINSTDNSIESVDTYSLEATPNLNVKFLF